MTSNDNAHCESWRTAFQEILGLLDDACRRHYGQRLVSLAVFGSVARGAMRQDSDIDFLVVAEPLPRGRMRRVEEFAPVERALDPALKAARRAGVHTRLSPLFKTPEEVRARSPILLDMTEDARLLFDRDGFLEGELAALRIRLESLGAKRVFRGEFWWWDLKPDLKPGEVFGL